MSRRGLSMVEMVVALGVLFISCSFLMSMFIAGSRLPDRAEKNLALSGLAQEKMDILMAQPVRTPPQAESGEIIRAGETFRFRIEVSPATFDAAMLEVTVTATSPDGRECQMKAIKPAREPVNPGWELLSSGLQCLNCHTVPSRPGVGTGDPAMAPPLTRDGLIAAADANGLSLEDYIRQSVRDPGAFVVSGYAPSMAGMPGVVDIPDADLDALVDYMSRNLR